MKRIDLEYEEHSNRVRRTILYQFMHCVLKLPSSKALAATILECKLETSTTTLYFPTKISDDWKNPIIPKIMDEHATSPFNRSPPYKRPDISDSYGLCRCHLFMGGSSTFAERAHLSCG